GREGQSVSRPIAGGTATVSFLARGEVRPPLVVREKGPAATGDRPRICRGQGNGGDCVCQGWYSKATQRLTSDGTAPATAQVLEALRALHPCRTAAPPPPAV
ncbi:hypothetical protein HMI55_002352, partial [Coelomomyces lativittatus]